jgi:hypothetical protein
MTKKLSGDTARDLVLRFVANYPEFVRWANDDSGHPINVNAHDVVDWLCNEIYALKDCEDIQDRAKNGTPEDDE